MSLNFLPRVRLLQRHLCPRTFAAVQKQICSSYTTGVSPDILKTRKSIAIEGSRMSYIDTGASGVGDKTVIFLHGNPTSAYLWRNVIPHVQGTARCLAPDLIGMGHSDKLENGDYTFRNHYKYLDSWVQKMDLPEKISIVCHDWGSALGFHWCNQHRDRVESVVHMEGLVDVIPSWDAFPEIASKFFQALRSPAGEGMVLDKNLFVELLFPKAIMRELTAEEMTEYRRPFTEPGEGRRPTLTWPREIPLATEGPEDVVQFARDYNSWLSSSTLPKLYVDASPGFFSSFIRKSVANWPNQKVVQVKGLHFLQEDSPEEIGKAIDDFLQDVYK